MSNRNPFLVDAPMVYPSFCLFLDLMGFTDDILEKDNEGLVNEHFKNIYTSFQKATHELLFKDEGLLSSGITPYQCKLFTDNIVIGCPLKVLAPDVESLFGIIILDIIECQALLTLDGNFLRGGWSFGNLFMDENMVYGKALIDAYHLEHESNYPRIILSDEVVERFVSRHVKYYGNPKSSPQNFHLLRDHNGKVFVNYLTEFVNDEDGYQEVDTASILKHKELITDRLKQFLGNDKIYPKYEWVASYHNYFCSNFIVEKKQEYMVELPSKYTITSLL